MTHIRPSTQVSCAALTAMWKAVQTALQKDHFTRLLGSNKEECVWYAFVIESFNSMDPGVLVVRLTCRRHSLVNALGVGRTVHGDGRRNTACSQTASQCKRMSFSVYNNLKQPSQPRFSQTTQSECRPQADRHNKWVADDCCFATFMTTQAAWIFQWRYVSFCFSPAPSKLQCHTLIIQLVHK